MYDLHTHILPGIDDGAKDLATSLEMARAIVAQGIEVVACTPHILPGVYANTGPQILAAVAALQTALDEHAIPLRLVAGADNHIVPSFVSDLRAGKLLPINGTRYVLVEPPHHVMPPRLDQLFFDICVAGYVPVLTHPERLTWVSAQYPLMARLVRSGVWMQITAGSLTGAFGPKPQALAERMLDDGLVHILASDAHGSVRRPPLLAEARDIAARRLSVLEATHLTVTRPRGILDNAEPLSLPQPTPSALGARHVSRNQPLAEAVGGMAGTRADPDHGGITGRLRRFFA